MIIYAIWCQLRILLFLDSRHSCPTIWYLIHSEEGKGHRLRLEAMWLMSYLLKGGGILHILHPAPLHATPNLAPFLVYYIHQLSIRDLKQMT